MSDVRPAEYPRELDEEVVLPDRRRLHVRALWRCEEGPIRSLYAQLSPRSRYLRFFSAVPIAPDPLMHLLACVDYRRTLALIVEHDPVHPGEAAEVIALGNFGAVDDRSAEVGLVVRDDWQRQHVGTELAHRVLRAAEARGFDRFIAHLLPDNVAIRRLLANVGRLVSTRRLDDMSEIAFTRR
jgi:RimJ/RimL family protein N-acetyltransferase